MFPTDEAQIERAEQRIKGPGGGALAAEERAVGSPLRPEDDFSPSHLQR